MSHTLSQKGALMIQRQMREVRACAARCKATRDDEQAVSVATQGPCKPNVKDTRPAKKLSPWPVMALALESATPCRRIQLWTQRIFDSVG